MPEISEEPEVLLKDEYEKSSASESVSKSESKSKRKTPKSVIRPEGKTLPDPETRSEGKTLTEPETCPKENGLAEPAPIGENWFNVLWSIKNFRFCYPFVSSIEISVDKIPYIIEISTRYTYLRFQVQCLKKEDPVINLQISLQTWDGSPEETITGCLEDALKVPKDIIYRSRRDSFLLNDTLKVRVQISSFAENQNLVINSEMGVRRKTFLWTIKDFSQYAENLDDDEDRMLKTLDDSDQCGEIVMFLKPEYRVNAEYYNIEVSRPGKKAACYCLLKVAIVDVEGIALDCARSEFVFEGDEPDHWVFSRIIKKSDLLWCKDRLLPKDTLSLKCDFIISTGEPTNEYHYTIYEDEETPETKSVDCAAFFEDKAERCYLSTDLEKTLQEKAFFDVNLKVGSEVIQAHKILLGSRSQFFKSELSNGNNGTIPISDFDVETMQELVRYLYTDAMPKFQWEKTKNLYLAAHKFKIPSLVKSCTSVFKDELAIRYVCGTLSLADSHEDKNLKKAVLDFISENSAIFFHSEEWEKFDNCSPLSVEVLRYVVTKRFR